MAGKPQTPPPPRRVQAPKRRDDRGGRSPDERRTWRILIGLAALGLIGVAVAVGLLLFRGGGSAEAAIRDAGCDLESAPAQGQGHVTQPPENFKPNTFPQTSGPHHPQAAPFDIYDDPVEQVRLVHNLEHGGVVIQYGKDVPKSDVDRITEWYRDQPNGLVVAPLPALNDKIALSAWTAQVKAGEQTPTSQRAYLAKCPRYDEKAFSEFVDRYGFQGPERFTKEMLAPGN